MIDAIIGYVLEKHLQESLKIRGHAPSLIKRWLAITEHIEDCPNCHMKLDSCSVESMDALGNEARKILTESREDRN